MPAPFLCFADFEFTCGGNINRWRTELLSVGLIICDANFSVVQRFYSTVKPVKQPKMTALCRQLTNLTQEEINLSPDSNDILAQVDLLLKQHPNDGLFVWGNYDTIGLSSDARIHRKCGLPNKHILKTSYKVVDIQKSLTDLMGLTDAINISELSTAFGFVPENGSFHNALNDAEGLFTIYKTVFTTNFTENEAFQALCAERKAKREAARQAVLERRNAAALSLPFSEEGQAYYKMLLNQAQTKDVNQFLMLRLAAVKVVRKYPNETRFLITTMNGKIRAYRDNAFPRNLRTPKRKYYCFTAQSLDHAVIAMLLDKESIELPRR